MQKITAKYITNNLAAMEQGQRITYRGAIYWLSYAENHGINSTKDTIYWIDADRVISGCINGHVYGKVIDGVAYRI